MSEPLLKNRGAVFGGKVPVREEPLDDGLGYYDTGTGEIVIDEGQPREGKLIALVHELLHLSETGAMQAGVIGDRLPEEFVARTAYVVAESLCESDLVDIDVNELRRVAGERE